jgi:hypothetical protein
MAIDWSKAPEGADLYANGHFRKIAKGIGSPLKWSPTGWTDGNWTIKDCLNSLDYSERPKQWPETDERINNIGLNRTTEDMGHYDEQREQHEQAQPKTAVEFLNACAAVQSERGKQYDASGTGERSFAAAASAFNAATGKSLTGSDVCLLLTMVKLVRQYSSPDRLHQDSLLDGVSYLSLWAEMLTKELGE